jgi:glucosamine 6-phosphate synthetase-like amidotransferase/phosphosugar isomerase protein
MCGLLGFIGNPIDKNKTKKLITELFDKTKVRGIDAAGYYCVDKNNNVFYKKKPGLSTNLIKTNAYEELWENELNIGLFHCRAASVGIGVPSDNKNNHPFVNRSNNKAIIHNGLINSQEYLLLKKFFDVESDCDSEIILRVLDREDKDISENIELLLSFTKNSMFAWAYAEKNESYNTLVITRNKHRPLFVADLREEFGQIIFFSTMEIYLNALSVLKKNNFSIKTQPKFFEVNPYDVIKIKNFKDNTFDIRISKCKKTNIDAFNFILNDKKHSNKTYLFNVWNKMQEMSEQINSYIKENEFSNIKSDEIIENMDDIIIRMNNLKDSII